MDKLIEVTLSILFVLVVIAAFYFGMAILISIVVWLANNIVALIALAIIIMMAMSLDRAAR